MFSTNMLKNVKKLLKKIIFYEQNHEKNVLQTEKHFSAYFGFDTF